LAATENCEYELGEAVMRSIKQKQALRLTDFQSQFRKKSTLSYFPVAQHELKSYDILTAQREVIHG